MFSSSRNNAIFIILILFALVLASCGTPEAAPEPTPLPPTATTAPTATSTPEPTNTPAPTETPTQNPTPVPTLGIGSTKVRESDGMPMVYVPAGNFLMGIEMMQNYDFMRPIFGTQYDKGMVIGAVEPVHSVFLDAYWVDQTEITNKMFAMCVEAGACEPPTTAKSDTREAYFGNPEFDDYPVIYVAHKHAEAYCEWAGGHLPTEAEWEKAARGEDARTYPWGEEDVTCELANISLYNYGGSPCVGDTVPVGSYPSGASPYGAMDMAGNVSEWVADWYKINYYIDSPEENPTGPEWGEGRVLRGGAYSSFQHQARTGSRGEFAAEWGAYAFMGFRCAMPTP